MEDCGPIPLSSSRAKPPRPHRGKMTVMRSRPVTEAVRDIAVSTLWRRLPASRDWQSASISWIAWGKVTATGFDTARSACAVDGATPHSRLVSVNPYTNQRLSESNRKIAEILWKGDKRTSETGIPDWIFDRSLSLPKAQHSGGGGDRCQQMVVVYSGVSAKPPQRSTCHRHIQRSRVPAIEPG